jgi:hypothetical protein
LQRTDLLQVASASFLRVTATTPGVQVVTAADVVSVTGEALIPFIRELVQQRRFVAEEALAWTGTPVPFEWHQLQPILAGLLERGVLARVR